jgi:hypothetical protein
VGTNGRITINSVTALAPSWLLVYSDNEGELGSLLGFARVDEGLNEVVSVQIPWREATAQVHAMLAADEGQPDLYDADADRLVLVGGQPIMASFTLTLPVDAFIRDQPVINNTVQIERVSMAAPGWAVIHPDDGGQPGLIIGFAFLEAGVNENVVVELLVSDATPQMYLRLHEDSGTAGEFDFPGGDGPLQVDGRVLPPITFRTDAGNYLISRDQPAGTAVTVPLAVVETSGWLAIYNNDRQSEPLGSAWLAPGINHNVSVTITAGQAGDTLYAVLHADNDTPQQFDYPDGNDQPLLRNRTAVQVPFLLTP